jgi:hypothetical protein
MGDLSAFIKIKNVCKGTNYVGNMNAYYLSDFRFMLTGQC